MMHRLLTYWAAALMFILAPACLQAADFVSEQRFGGENEIS